ncbi:hypothetical protein EVAR_103307_1 [Eumeta japonica]|uniref:Uncharacterized protein n=1 Tax=Eumeta variegata TaxID=151549 RepID=A0A4C1XT87_EUMVA|nr:hypothetical protein EVAR_103307_1 [Eumeta japonica]
MLWVWKSIIHYEFLPPGKTISSYLCCQQLMRLKREVKKKRPELINSKSVVFHHNNVRPYRSLATQQIKSVWVDLGQQENRFIERVNYTRFSVNLGSAAQEDSALYMYNVRPSASRTKRLGELAVSWRHIYRGGGAVSGDDRRGAGDAARPRQIYTAVYFTVVTYGIEILPTDFCVPATKYFLDFSSGIRDNGKIFSYGGGVRLRRPAYRYLIELNNSEHRARVSALERGARAGGGASVTYLPAGCTSGRTHLTFVQLFRRTARGQWAGASQCDAALDVINHGPRPARRAAPAAALTYNPPLQVNVRDHPGSRSDIILLYQRKNIKKDIRTAARADRAGDARNSCGDLTRRRRPPPARAGGHCCRGAAWAAHGCFAYRYRLLALKQNILIRVADAFEDLIRISLTRPGPLGRTPAQGRVPLKLTILQLSGDSNFKYQRFRSASDGHDRDRDRNPNRNQRRDPYSDLIFSANEPTDGRQLANEDKRLQGNTMKILKSRKFVRTARQSGCHRYVSEDVRSTAPPGRRAPRTIDPGDSSLKLLEQCLDARGNMADAPRALTENVSMRKH